jgi:hypothetical protein
MKQHLNICFKRLLPFSFLALVVNAQAEESTNKPIYSAAGITVAPNPQPQPSQWMICADFLYWKADVENTEVAERTSLTATSSSNENIALNGRWEPGFRVGIGGRYGQCIKWETLLTWTHLYSRSHHIAKSADGVDVFLRPLAMSTIGPKATSLSAQWRLSTNILDLETGQIFSPAAKLSLVPHIGIRGALFDFHMHQKLQGLWTFFGFTTPGDPSTPPNLSDPNSVAAPTSGKANFQYAGIGLKADTDAVWRFNETWSILGKIAGSLLYGKYEISQHYQGFTTDIFQDSQPLLIPLDSHFKKNMWRMRGNIEAFLGLQWEIKYGADEQYVLALAGGYEMSQWFQLNEIPALEDGYEINNSYNASNQALLGSQYYVFETPAHGSISYQGLTLKASFSF